MRVWVWKRVTLRQRLPGEAAVFFAGPDLPLGFQSVALGGVAPDFAIQAEGLFGGNRRAAEFGEVVGLEAAVNDGAPASVATTPRRCWASWPS
jgi:hypothetical protein